MKTHRVEVGRGFRISLRVDAEGVVDYASTAGYRKFVGQPWRVLTDWLIYHKIPWRSFGWRKRKGDLV